MWQRLFNIARILQTTALKNVCVGGYTSGRRNSLSFLLKEAEEDEPVIVEFSEL